MMQYVNTVLVGKTQGTSISANTINDMAAGSIVMVDETGTFIKTENDAKNAKIIKLGLVTGRSLTYTKPDGTTGTVKDVTYSNYIPKNSIRSFVQSNFAASSEDVITFNFNDFTPVVGHRYVIRIIYKDLYEHPGQFTHSYEDIATSTSITELVENLKKQINKDSRRRVTATTNVAKASKTIGGVNFEAINAGSDSNSITIEFKAATSASEVTVNGKAIVITPKTGELTASNIKALIEGNADAVKLVTVKSGSATGSAVSATNLVGGSNADVLTLTALPKNDNEGKESINLYTQVNMVATMYYTDPSAAGFASKNKYPLLGLEIDKVAGTPGKGNAKLIRDREQAALGYKGITNRTWWPVIKPELNVDLSKSYDVAVIEFEPIHANAEDNFSKTKQSVELYVENATTMTSTLIYKMIKAFINDEVSAA